MVNYGKLVIILTVKPASKSDPSHLNSKLLILIDGQYKFALNCFIRQYKTAKTELCQCAYGDIHIT